MFKTARFEDRAFKPLSIAVIAVSDTRTLETDTGGALLKSLLEADGHSSFERQVVRDDIQLIRAAVQAYVANPKVDVILTTGGTGFSPRDVTPEATRAVIEREAPGLAEAMRAASLKVTPHAMLSRIVTGIRRQTLIINLPGSPKGAVENLQVILPVLPHAVQLLREDPASESSH